MLNCNAVPRLHWILSHSIPHSLFLFPSSCSVLNIQIISTNDRSNMHVKSFKVAVQSQISIWCYVLFLCPFQVRKNQLNYTWWVMYIKQIAYIRRKWSPCSLTLLDAQVFLYFTSAHNLLATHVIIWHHHTTPMFQIKFKFYGESLMLNWK